MTESELVKKLLDTMRDAIIDVNVLRVNYDAIDSYGGIAHDIVRLYQRLVHLYKEAEEIEE